MKYWKWLTESDMDDGFGELRCVSCHRSFTGRSDLHYPEWDSDTEANNAAERYGVGDPWADFNVCSDCLDIKGTQKTHDRPVVIADLPEAPRWKGNVLEFRARTNPKRHGTTDDPDPEDH